MVVRELLKAEYGTATAPSAGNTTGRRKTPLYESELTKKHMKGKATWNTSG